MCLTIKKTKATQQKDPVNSAIKLTIQKGFEIWD